MRLTKYWAALFKQTSIVRFSDLNHGLRCRIANWIFVCCAVAYGLIAVLATGLVAGWGEWYSLNPHYREQIAAILSGSLALSRDASALSHDLAWAEGGVHQVWGLGVPIFSLPFEILARLAGKPGFPDILVFGAAMAGAAWALFSTLFGGSRNCGLASRLTEVENCQASFFQPDFSIQSNRTCGSWLIFACALALLFPPFTNLLRSRFDIYEEAVAYEYLFGVVLISGLLGLARKPSRNVYTILCLLSGIGGLIRPTLVFHGISVVVSGAALLWFSHQRGTPKRGEGIRQFGHGWFGSSLAGLLLFFVGGGLLFIGNLCRFGSGFEFGHKLNVQYYYGSLYATRFDNPYQTEPIFSAIRELFGLLFLVKRFNGGNFYLAHFFPGQSSTVRWREMYLTGYDLSFLPFLLLGVMVVGFACRRLWSPRHQSEPLNFLKDALWLRAIVALGLYGTFSSVLLLGFYLRREVISSRYLLDLMPSFVAMMLAAWLGWGRWWLARTAGRWVLPISGAIIAGWLAWETHHGSCAYGPPCVLTWEEAQAQQHPTVHNKNPPASGVYDSATAPPRTGIRYNGAGWEVQSGIAMPCIILFVNDPAFLELEVTPQQGPDSILEPVEFRAKIGLEFLKREYVKKTENGWLIHFSGPMRRRYQTGLQPAFLATVSNSHLADDSTPWRLLKVRWR